jgi:WD40 repeat protein
MGKAAVLLAGALLLAPQRSPSYVTVGFSSDGRHLVTAGVNLPVKIWELSSGKEVRQLAPRTAWASRATYLPDGSVLVAGDKDEKIRVFAPNGTAGDPLGEQRDTIPWTALSANGKLLALRDKDRIAVLDVAASRPVRSFKAPDLVWSCAFGPDGKKLAALFGTAVQLWSLESGQELLKIETRENCYAMAFSPDGKTIVCGADAGILTFWDAEKGSWRFTLSHPGAILGLAYSPDGKKLASVSADGTTRVWDPAAGKLLRVLQGGRGTVTFSPDGKTLAAGGDSGYKMVWVWDADNGKEILKLQLQ